MTLAYLLAPIPKWVILNNEGTAAGGAQLYTYRSLNKIQPKPVFQDPGGTEPWTNPILFDLNGVQGPFYWEVDSTNLNDTYYLEAYDSDNNLLRTIDNYFPNGTGGGGDVTTYIPIQNYITNNQVINHIAPTASPIALTNLVIAPSNHHGFTPADVNPLVATYGVVGPDIRFIKNNTSATDQISFPLFPLSSAPLVGDVTPVDYIRYQCTNTPTGETYKNFQFPITQKVKNLSNQAMTFTLWAAVTTTPVTLNIYLRQYYGSGVAATPDTRTLIGSCTLSTTWTPFTIQFVVPNVSGNSIGTPGLQTNDDAVYLQIEMPLGEPCDVLFTKPCLFLGAIDNNLEFDSYDQIDSIDLTPRTGDIKTSLLTNAPMGWVPMNDGTIGNIDSSATLVAADYAFQLYSTIYCSVVDAWAPVIGGRTAPGNTMAAAVTDFLALKPLTLPRSLGRALAGAGAGQGLPTYVLGEYEGAATSTALIEHSHTATTGGFFQVGSTTTTGGGTGTNFTVVSATSPAGSGSSFSLLQPTSFFNVFIKL